jgi:hypothetical protein
VRLWLRDLERLDRHGLMSFVKDRRAHRIFLSG